MTVHRNGHIFDPNTRDVILVLFNQMNEMNQVVEPASTHLVLSYIFKFLETKVVQQDRKFRALSKKFDKSKRQNYHDKNMFRSFAKLQFVI